MGAYMRYIDIIRTLKEEMYSTIAVVKFYGNKTGKYYRNPLKKESPAVKFYKKYIHNIPRELWLNGSGKTYIQKQGINKI